MTWKIAGFNGAAELHSRGGRSRVEILEQVAQKVERFAHRDFVQE